MAGLAVVIALVAADRCWPRAETASVRVDNTATVPAAAAMRWLREDPRYFRWMQTRSRVEYWESHGYPRGWSPVDGPDGRHLSCPG